MGSKVQNPSVEKEAMTIKKVFINGRTPCWPPRNERFFVLFVFSTVENMIAATVYG